MRSEFSFLSELSLQHRTCWSLNVFCNPQWHSWMVLRERESARLPSDFIVMDMDLWFYGLGSERNSQRERDEEKETKRKIERGRGFKKNSHVRRMCFMAVFSMECLSGQSCCETWLVFGYGRSRWQRKGTVLTRCQTPDTSVCLAFVSVRGGK